MRIVFPTNITPTYGTKPAGLFLEGAPRPVTTKIFGPRDRVGAERITRAENGGKAYGLGQALAKGFMVPEFFAVTTAAFREFMSINKLWDLLPDYQALLAPGFNRSEPQNKPKWEKYGELLSAIQKCSLPARLEREIEAKCAQIRALYPGATFAVRSSSMLEDGTLSFAGQYSTTLDVADPEEIKQNIKVLYASLFRVGLIRYLKEHGVTEQDNMAVIIQRMIPHPQFLGVIHDPLSTAPDTIAVEYHVGEHRDAVVSARKSPLIVDLLAADPSVEVFRNDAVRMNSGYYDLPDMVRGEITKLHFAYAQTGIGWDFEFGVGANDQFWFLQGRQLTDLEGAADFTLEEALKGVSPKDILFTSQISRGKTERDGIICPVVTGYVGDEGPVHVLRQSSGGILDGVELSLQAVNLRGIIYKAIRDYDLTHSNYALVVDAFPSQVYAQRSDDLHERDLHEMTPHKKVVITVDFAGRESHILTIMRENPKLGLVYVGIKGRLDLIPHLRDLQYIRVIADGYRAAVLRVRPEELRSIQAAPAESGFPEGVVSTRIKHDHQFSPIEGDLLFEVEPNADTTPEMLLDDLQTLLEVQGLKVDWERVGSGRFSLDPTPLEADSWNLGLGLHGGKFDLGLSYQPERDEALLKLLKRYFRLN